MQNQGVKVNSTGDKRFDIQIRRRLAKLRTQQIAVIGNEQLLFENTLGLLCSVKCPGSIILKIGSRSAGRLKIDYSNGRSYYPLHGVEIAIPLVSEGRPTEEFLQWHNEKVFLG